MSLALTYQSLVDERVREWTGPLAESIPGGLAGMLSEHARGALHIWLLSLNSEPVGVLWWSVDREIDGKAALHVQAAFIDAGQPLASQTLALIERAAIEGGCDRVIFQTARPGLHKLAKSLGYRAGWLIVKDFE